MRLVVLVVSSEQPRVRRGSQMCAEVHAWAFTIERNTISDYKMQATLRNDLSLSSLHTHHVPAL